MPINTKSLHLTGSTLDQLKKHFNQFHTNPYNQGRSNHQINQSINQLYLPSNLQCSTQVLISLSQNMLIYHICTYTHAYLKNLKIYFFKFYLSLYLTNLFTYLQIFWQKATFTHARVFLLYCCYFTKRKLCEYCVIRTAVTK